MPTPEDLLNNPPAPAADPNAAPATPPADGNDQPPADVPATPAPNPDNAWQDGKSYKDLIGNVGENVINDMIDNKEKIIQILDDPAQLEKLTKEEIVELYKAKDKLTKQLDEILPIKQEQQQRELAKLADSIKDPAVKDYVIGKMKELEDPEDVKTFIEMVEELTGVIGKWATPAPANANGDDQAPANLNANLNGWAPADPKWGDVDVNEAMLSPDPEVRKRARLEWDKQMNSLNGK